MHTAIMNRLQQLKALRRNCWSRKPQNASNVNNLSRQDAIHFKIYSRIIPDCSTLLTLQYLLFFVEERTRARARFTSIISIIRRSKLHKHSRKLEKWQQTLDVFNIYMHQNMLQKRKFRIWYFKYSRPISTIQICVAKFYHNYLLRAFYEQIQKQRITMR